MTATENDASTPEPSDSGAKPWLEWEAALSLTEGERRTPEEVAERVGPLIASLASEDTASANEILHAVLQAVALRHRDYRTAYAEKTGASYEGVPAGYEEVSGFRLPDEWSGVCNGCSEESWRIGPGGECHACNRRADIEEVGYDAKEVMRRWKACDFPYRDDYHDMDDDAEEE